MKINFKSKRTFVVYAFIVTQLLFLPQRTVFSEDLGAPSPSVPKVNAISVSGQVPAAMDAPETPASFEEIHPKTIYINSKVQDEIHMIRGDLETIKVRSLTRISVSNPDIADISSVDSDQLIILAKKGGQTTLFLWEETGKRTVVIRVFEEDLLILKDRIEAILKRADVKGVTLDVSDYEGKLIATGSLSKEKRAEFALIIKPFTNTLRDLTKEENIEDLVQIDVQIAELTASWTETLGLDWTSAVTYQEDPSKFVSTAARDIFKVGPLSRTTQISTIVNALVTQGKGRVLSKPKLVVKSGKEASFQVGGQIPVSTTTTTSGGSVQQNVEFKDYGIDLTITPTIKDGKVDVVMSVDVSDVDQGNAVGENVAFTTRTAQTQLFLENGQSVVLAGLIKHNEGHTISKIPFLGDIPLLGLAFRKKTSPSNSDTELVITLTPTIISHRGESKHAEAALNEKIPPVQPMMEDDSSVQEGISFKEKPVDAVEMAQEKDVLSVSPQMTTVSPAASESESVMPPKNEPSSTEFSPEDIKKYTESIARKISQSITYPYEAKEKGWEGIVKLSLRILKDGSLADVSVKESSGFSVFDKDAVNTAQILSPYNSFPEGASLNELIIVAPIVYSQQALMKSPNMNFSMNMKDSAASESAPAASTVKFAEAVQKRIADVVEYPEEAREYGWEGTVKLSLVILKDGTLASVSLKSSSGYEIFDKLALKIAKDVSPYSDFPTEIDSQELNIAVPIVFSLERE